MVTCFGRSQAQNINRQDQNSLSQAEHLFKKERYSEALKIYENLNTNYPGQLRILLNAGECCFLLNESDNALTYFKEASKVLEGNTVSAAGKTANKKYMEKVTKRISDCNQLMVENGEHKSRIKEVPTDEVPAQADTKITTKIYETENKVLAPAVASEYSATEKPTGSTKIKNNIVEDQSSGTKWKLFSDNPISLRRFKMIGNDDHSFRLPTEKELMNFINYAFEQKKNGNGSMMLYLLGDNAEIPYLTSDYELKMGSQEYRCILIESDRSVVEYREDIDEVKIILINQN